MPAGSPTAILHHEYAPAPGSNGHYIDSSSAFWTAVLESCLAARGLPSRPQ